MERVELKKPTPFKKGHKLSVGHKGYTLEDRRRKRFMTAALEHQLLKAAKKGNASRNIDVIAERIVQIAKLGKSTDAIAAFNVLANRVEGMPKQTIEQNTTLNARTLAVQVTKEITASEACKMYQQALDAPIDVTPTEDE